MSDVIDFAVWAPDEATFWASWVTAGIIEIDAETGERRFTSEYPGVHVSSQTDQGWTPTRATGATYNIPAMPLYEEDGVTPVLDESGQQVMTDPIYDVPIYEPVPGWHANVRVTGPLVAEMTYGIDQYDENGVLKNVFDRTWATLIFQLEWREADATTGFPAGYRNATGVWYCDPRDLSSPTNVWL